jgi:hypothetical protein
MALKLKKVATIWEGLTKGRFRVNAFLERRLTWMLPPCKAALQKSVYSLD